jgi:hypothetical protein
MTAELKQFLRDQIGDMLLDLRTYTASNNIPIRDLYDTLMEMDFIRGITNLRYNEETKEIEFEVMHWILGRFRIEVPCRRGFKEGYIMTKLNKGGF